MAQLDNDFGIYIPSRGRAEVLGRLFPFPEEFHPLTEVVVGEAEFKEYDESVPPEAGVTPCPVSGIASVRQWVLENAKTPYVLFVSDDVKFSYRNNEGKLKPASDYEIRLMLELLYGWLRDDGYIHVGVSQRAFNHTTEKPFVTVGRMNDVYGYNRLEVLDSGARFDRLRVMEDFDLTLTLLEKGFPNIITHEYAWSQRKSGEAGGCAFYRTGDVQRKAAFQLEQLHPGCVKVLAKRSKTDWEGGVGEARTDVNVQWAKAYRPRHRAASGGLSKWV